ncbi:energy transducer TonB [Chryseobacterium sp. Mn2064]|uniref:energy transducer TonB n=1 Tax=Chryseobacterium sp. Mn2064 TaxID=3395263 RepID=UPI003BD039EC
MKKTLVFIIGFGFGLTFAQTEDAKAQPLEEHPKDQQHIVSNIPSEYPGGMMVLRKDIADKIRTKRIKGVGIITARAKFIVNVKGKIENIVVTGDNVDFNKETERAIKSLKAQWKPAESNGTIVRSYYTFPLTINFD